MSPSLPAWIVISATLCLIATAATLLALGAVLPVALLLGAIAVLSTFALSWLLTSRAEPRNLEDDVLTPPDRPPHVP